MEQMCLVPAYVGRGCFTPTLLWHAWLVAAES